ncbi:MAG TPA: TIR domain-containing protein [Opitutaceae bacterium]|jgi:TolB-like protein
MPESPGPRGVFLSYAREDTDSAKRIADALRGFGVEVWFDQAELRGGDAWDANIRRQIRECCLFVAVVSATTQARGEGYFRREWRLAIDRTHDMAAGIPFIIPVVIDDTLESKALVPEEFMRVQWTRLPGGTPTPLFVERIKRLTEKPGAQPPGHGSRHPGFGGEPKPKKQGSPVPGWVWGAVAGAVAAAAVFIALRKGSPAPAPTPAPAAKAEAIPKADDKSIAVLPFENMSDQKDNQFFTDGIQDDILTDLALVRQLRVISRTSVEQYRDTKKPIGQIAAELGVAYILEGSVRREGNRVRVTGQLIHAATDDHVWAKAYERDLTDIFAIQSELAQAIATELQAALSPEEKALLDRRPTQNTEAYDLYLKARRLVLAEDAGERRELLKKAVDLDSSFAWAWGDLADDYAFGAFQYREGVEGRLAAAKDAIDQAVQLAPNDPEVIGSLGTYYYYGFRDYARANEQYQRLLKLRPNDAAVYNSLSLILRREGKWAESLEYSRRAIHLDVANVGYLGNHIATLEAARRYDELADARRKMVALRPEKFDLGFDVALVPFYATGSTKEAEDFIAHMSPEEADSPKGIEIRKTWADYTGNVTEWVRLARIQPVDRDTMLEDWENEIETAAEMFICGEKATAVQMLGTIPGELEKRIAREPNNPRLWAFKGFMEIVVGNNAEAVRSEEKATSLMPASLDALDSGIYASLAAYIYNIAGEKERALELYKRELSRPNTMLVNVHKLETQIGGSLHGDPRFEALLRDPANNAPLF